MKHSSIVPPSEIHSAWCGCRDCAQADPIAFARHRRIVRLQAAALLSLLALLYGVAAFNWRGIEQAFSAGGL